MGCIIKKFNLTCDTRNTLLILSILIFLSPSSDHNLLAQQLHESKGFSRTDDLREELYICSDRNIYIAGEQLWFKIYK